MQHTASLPPIGIAANLVEQVANVLRERIASGGFAPSERLPTEAGMSVSFGVSRTVVREAVARLKSEGLLLSRQGSGVFVCEGAQLKPLRLESAAGRSLASVLHIVELRRAIEAESAALAASRRSADDIKAMRTTLKELDAAVARGESGVAQDVQFHKLIAAASRNPYFLSVLDFLGQFLAEAIRVTRANEARREDFSRAVKAEHAAIFAAIEAGDAAAARRTGTRHMVNAANRINMADAAFWSSPEMDAAQKILKR
jgi:GntR family transcriptional repressor for pyruvate dehydrogenase complex